MNRAIVAACVLASGPTLGHRGATAQEDAGNSFCMEGEPCWPTGAQWRALGENVGGRLERPRSPIAHCLADPTGASCAQDLQALRSPYALQDQPGATQSLGWLGAWTSEPSAYAVLAARPADIVAAVKFARKHRLRLVVKGTGHDYLGRSNAPASLLVSTHALREVRTIDAFTPRGCTTSSGPAVSVGAGARWLEVYREVTGRHHRYVQGGGCTSVGAVGGFIQGGGFGSWSKKFGIAAAGMLEAEVVTADGRVRVANACQNQDLFWALRGGGGGTYGVVTRATLMTHALPAFFGFVLGSVKANDDGAFAELLEHFVAFYRQRLANEHWGESVAIRSNNSLELGMAFEGMGAGEAEQVWSAFRSWIGRSPQRYSMSARFVEIPAVKMWDAAFIEELVPAAIRRDLSDDGRLFWWATNQDEVATYWYAYQSHWLPEEGFSQDGGRPLARALFAASRRWPVELHFNKGQAGASAEALARDRQTSVNPKVYAAAALAIIGAHGRGLPNVHGQEPDVEEGQRQAAAVSGAMKILIEATPGAGAYVNEADYFERDWKRTFWGDNYARLLVIKHKYDPTGVFFCHHCVGSDEPRRR